MRALFLLLCAFALSGCATWPHKSDANLSPSERTLVVKDCLAILTEQFQPAKTSVCLVADEEDILTKDLQAAMRAAGYAVVTDEKAKDDRSTIYAYMMDPGTILLRLSIGARWGADRLYHRELDGGVSPLNGFTIRNGGTKNG